MYADIVVNISAEQLDRVFQYSIPDALKEKAVIGAGVYIPFGRGNRQIEGYIIDLKENSDYPIEKIKEISGVKDNGITAEGQLIELAANMKTVYGSTMAAALKTVIPVNKQIRKLSEKSYTLLLDSKEAEKLLENYRNDKRRGARVKVLEALLKESILQKTWIEKELGVSDQVIKAMEKEGIISLQEKTIYRNPSYLPLTGQEEIVLNQEQKNVVKEIGQHPGKVHLIHGITGSGKTEVYIELISETLEQNKQVIVLIPEIALTAQTVSRFYRKFGDRVSVMNSKLSAGERYDQYMRAKQGDVDIIVGPRSALFMPFERLGLIIIDEEHDGAYKSETVPKYHAREVAIWRSSMCNATVVLGSATPSVVSYAKAKQGVYYLHQLTKRAKEDSRLAQVSVVDLREEFKQHNRSILSHSLYEEIQQRLEKKQQVMLFLNRRGFAGFVSCRQCGHVFKCKHCNVSLTSHRNGRLKCHYCGYEEQMPKHCPQCGSPYIALLGTGTQKVEAMVEEAFPESTCLRLDRDAASKKNGVDTIIETFKNQEADILVGTQMIVKGHDFPKVTLVGILAADMSMFSGDYMAAERTFDLLVQAAGRAGRGNLPGEVIIQTYNPEHYSVVAAAKQDYEAFYEEEIIYREMMHYPPFYHMLAILGESTNMELLQEAMEGIGKQGATNQEFEIIGPADAYVSKGKDAYRKVIYIKSKQQRPLIMFKTQAEQFMASKTQFRKVYIQYDMDPMNMY